MDSLAKLSPLSPATTLQQPMPLLHQATVVSADSKSPEAILSRQADQINKQMAVDTKYDAIVERFCVMNTMQNGSLLLIAVLGILAIGILKRK
jgi:hypothetical protein